MYFSTFHDLMYMSGHGFYVWMAYSISLTVLMGLTVYPLRKKTRMLNAIRQRALHDKGADNVDASEA